MITMDTDDRNIQIEDRQIRDGHETFIIAEAGINHNGDLDVAKELVTEASENGADAVKFQTYDTDRRVDGDDPLYDVFDKCELSYDEFRELHSFAQEKEIIFFSTAFHVEDVEFLEELDVPAYKAASFHVTHKRMLKAMARTGKPVILSRGMATEDEIREAVDIFNEHDTPHALLHCVSSYPTMKHDANLNIINTLRERFDCPIGYSDHTFGPQVSKLSVAVGGTIIEKHFTLDTEMDGPDHEHSLDPAGLQELTDKVREVEEILGEGGIRKLNCEAEATRYRVETE